MGLLCRDMFLQAHHSLFEKLPPELQRDIFKQLDYKTLINLSQCSRFLAKAVDPQSALWHDKFAFTLRAENYFKKHFPGQINGRETLGNFACYFCFRVRGPYHFDQSQPVLFTTPRAGWYRKVTDEDLRTGRAKNAVSLRRFCIECGVKHGIHQPGDLLRTKTGQELWVCHCWRIWTKPTHLRCNRCQANCPFSAKADC